MESFRYIDFSTIRTCGKFHRKVVFVIFFFITVTSNRCKIWLLYFFLPSYTHQKSNSAIARKREKTSNLSEHRSKSPLLGATKLHHATLSSCQKLCNQKQQQQQQRQTYFPMLATHNKSWFPGGVWANTNYKKIEAIRCSLSECKMPQNSRE